MGTEKNRRHGAALGVKESSPFTPGNPVPVEFFVGRTEQIQEILRYARQACSGRLENVFLSGDRGIGKSSLARFVRELCLKECGMLGVHAFLGGVTTVEEMVRRVFDQLLKDTHTQSWFDKIKGLFGDFISEVGLFGVSVKFDPPKDKLRALVSDFPSALRNLLERIRQDNKGLVVVLDDLNGLADRVSFANWYKSFVDSVAVHGWHFPVLFLLCGLPERRTTLSMLQPSLMRIFRVAEVGRLRDEEVAQFLVGAFQTAGLRVDDLGLRAMVRYSSGLPAFMHEIGEATFLVDADGIVDAHDAGLGIYGAAEKVGQKYLDPRVYRAIRSKRYHGILGKLVPEPGSVEFRKQDVEERLNEEERRVFHNFLRRMRELAVIEADMEKPRGSYRFVNQMYPVYIFLHGARARRQ